MNSNDIFVINLYHDTMNKIYHSLFRLFYGIADFMMARYTYHKIMHIQTEKEKTEMKEWFDDFKKNVHDCKVEFDKE